MLTLIWITLTLSGCIGVIAAAVMTAEDGYEDHTGFHVSAVAGQHDQKTRRNYPWAEISRIDQLRR